MEKANGVAGGAYSSNFANAGVRMGTNPRCCVNRVSVAFLQPKSLPSRKSHPSAADPEGLRGGSAGMPQMQRADVGCLMMR